MMARVTQGVTFRIFERVGVTKGDIFNLLSNKEL